MHYIWITEICQNIIFLFNKTDVTQSKNNNHNNIPLVFSARVLQYMQNEQITMQLSAAAFTFWADYLRERQLNQTLTQINQWPITLSWAVVVVVNKIAAMLLLLFIAIWFHWYDFQCRHYTHDKIICTISVVLQNNSLKMNKQTRKYYHVETQPRAILIRQTTWMNDYYYYYYEIIQTKYFSMADGQSICPDTSHVYYC